MSLKLTNFDDAFKNDIKDFSINQSTNLNSEKCYMNTQKQSNDQFSKYQNTNYRKIENKKKIDIDDKLTRGNFSSKPLDKLAEHTTFEKYIHHNLQKCVNNQNSFLTSTNLSCQPQKNYNGNFNIQGISTSNYGRKTYKKQ